MAITIDMVMNPKLKICVLKNVSSLHKKHNRINRGSLYKGFCKLSPYDYKIKFNTMLDAGLRDVPNFIGTFLFSIKNWDLKNTCEMLSDVLKNKSSGFMVGRCYFQAFRLIGSKIYEPFVQQNARKIA